MCYTEKSVFLDPEFCGNNLQIIWVLPALEERENQDCVGGSIGHMQHDQWIFLWLWLKEPQTSGFLVPSRFPPSGITTGNPTAI